MNNTTTGAMNGLESKPEQTSILGDVHQAEPHDSAHKHVTGSAEYIDDIPVPANCLHAALGLSTQAHAEIVSIDLDAVRSCEGVVSVLCAKDVPGSNDISPAALNDEPVFAEKKVDFYGQPVFAVIANSREQARFAASQANIQYHSLHANLSIDDALQQASSVTAALAPTAQQNAVSSLSDNYLKVQEIDQLEATLVTTPLTLKRGDATTVLESSAHRIQQRMRVGGQDHFYLEGQIALAIPGEDDEMLVYSSTQHPSEVQHMVSHALGVASHAVTVKVRRMGGGFGGKETQSNLFAAVAAIAAKQSGCAVKLRPDRDDDMVATGKRHDFRIDYDIGFANDGKITAFSGVYAARCGFSADLSGPVTDRALFHADNAYYYPAVELRSLPLKTNTVSNTAFRGFGGPQGLLSAERGIEEIAYALGMDPLDVRLANLYGDNDRNVTPYHQTIKDNILPRLLNELCDDADYRARRRDIIEFNKRNPVIKKGIALTPVKFGISFTATWLNQAGALLHIYQDGSVLLNHGGTEMGQGLFTKVAQVVANELQIDLNRIKVSGTATDKVPNTSATAASSGSDLNAMAALDAAQQIKQRLVEFAAEKFNVSQDQISFDNNHIIVAHENQANDTQRSDPKGLMKLSFDELIKAAYMARVNLSANGFYKTPDIHWDRTSGKGQPFYYFAYGASVSEVSIDTLTGEYQVDRVDILHDVGQSLNPAIDKGQIEGGFVQGMGWLTTEELWWDKKGQLRTHAPSTYKIPLASDVPAVFNVKLAQWSTNPARTIRRSKAVGEPPLMLAASVLEALSMAVASVSDYQECPRLNTPATPEEILLTIRRLLARQ